MKNVLGGLTSKLTSWKGPPGVDRRILFGSGQLVIGGFVAGLESTYPKVRSSLNALTDSLSASATLNTTARASGVGGGASSATVAAARAAVATAGVTIIQNIEGAVIRERELIEVARDGLIRVGEHNAGAVIGGLG